MSRSSFSLVYTSFARWWKNDHPITNDLSYYKKFNGYLTQQFWQGLNFLYSISSELYLTLRIEIITNYRNRLITEYKGFHLLDSTEYKFKYDAQVKIEGRKWFLFNYLLYCLHLLLFYYLLKILKLTQMLKLLFIWNCLKLLEV